MVAVLGLDIGGANTKAAFLRTRDGNIEEFKTLIRYFPFWRHSASDLVDMFSNLRNCFEGSSVIDCVALTLTAELSDVYRTKREGVNHILDCVVQAFSGLPLLVLDVNAKFLSVEDAKNNPLDVAAANWAATGWMVSQKISDCIIIDVGSTSTSIIPIAEGKIVAVGKTDLEKLMNGELVYTGCLRTNVATIVNSIPIRCGVSRVSSELFAQSGDVHLVLGNIGVDEYSVDTADGKGKTRKDALTRLARIVCGDTDMLSKQEIVQIASYIFCKQIDQIAEGITQVRLRLEKDFEKPFVAVVTGLGKDFLARKAAEKAWISKVIDMEVLTAKCADLASPAAGVALMAATKLEGRRIIWMQ